MGFQIVWSRTAIWDLDQVVRYIERERPRSAAKFRSKMKKAVSRLGPNPYSGSPCEIEGFTKWREIYCDSYRVMYRVFDSKNEILIGHVRHAARDEPTRADLLG